MVTDTASDEQTAYPPVSWGIKAIILAGGPTVGLAIGGVAVVLPKIEAALAHGPGDAFLVKMLGGAIGAAMLVGAPLTGFLADRLGLRRVLFLNYILYAVAGSAGMYLSSLPLLVLSRFLVGVAGAGAVTASIIIINKRLAPAQRPTWLGGYNAVANCAGIVLYPLGGILAEWNWHYAFAIYLIGAPLALLALIAFKGGPETDMHSVAMVGEKEPNLLAWFPFRFGLLGLLLGFIMYLDGIYVPFVLSGMGVGPANSSFIMMASSVTGTVSALFFGRSRRFLSTNAAFALACGVAGAGCVLMALTREPAMVMVGMAMLGLGQGWFLPNLMVALGNVVKPGQQGRAVGLVKGTNYLAMPLCVVIMQWPSQLYGPWVSVMLAGIIALGLATLFLFSLVGPRSGKKARSIPAPSASS